MKKKHNDQKSPLERGSLTIMVVAVAVIVLSFSYALGFDILSFVFPESQEASQALLFDFMLFAYIVCSISLLFFVSHVIQRLLRRTPSISSQKSPLERGSLTIMVVAVVVIVLSFSYALGIDLLSRIFPGLPEPSPISTSSPFSVFTDLIFPLSCLAGMIGVILISLKNILEQKSSWGVKPEFILIAISFIMTGLALQFLGDNIPYEESLRSSLYSISLVLGVSGLGSLVGGVLYRLRCPNRNTQGM